MVSPIIVAAREFMAMTRKRRGFTLIELLTAALIGLIFLTATATIIIQFVQIEREETGRSEVQAEISQVMDFITADLKEAVYVYNDADGNNVPDILERLYYSAAADPGPPPIPERPNRILQIANSIPVLAFWKQEDRTQLPAACFVSRDREREFKNQIAELPENPLPRTVATTITVVTDSTTNPPTTERRIQVQSGTYFSLVTYYLRRNIPQDNTPWEGSARIIRSVLRPVNAECNARRSYFRVDPDPSDFLNWPNYPGAAAQLAPVFSEVSPDELATNIFWAGENAPECPQGFDFGGGRPDPDITDIPLQPASADIEPLPNPNFPDAGFYTCVQRMGDRLLPQSIFVSLTGISMDRANAGLFRRYEQDRSSLEDEQVARYLHTLESQALARAVFGRT